MQHTLDLWESGLRATGGALAPDKSHWYLIVTGWKKNGDMYYLSEQEALGTVTARNPKGEREPLQRVPPNKALRTLGVRLAPDGNNKAEAEYLTERSHHFADLIRAGSLPRPLVWLAMTTTIFKTIEYPLPATTFTETECHAIIRPILMAGLPASGIARTFPRALVHGPVRFQGLGLPDPWATQGTQHIIKLLVHGACKDSILGQQIRNSLECLILDAGLPGTIFDQSIPIRVYNNELAASHVGIHDAI